MIRGQPRTNAHGSTSPSAPPRGAAPRPYPRRSPGGGSPPASGLTTPNPEYRYNGRRRPQHAVTMPPPVTHRQSYNGSYQAPTPGFDVAGGSSQMYLHPPSSYSDPSFSNIDIASLFPTGPLAFDPQAAGIAATPDSATFDFSLTVPSAGPYEPLPQEVPAAGPDPVQTQHVLYYFEHVRKMQFAFAGSNLVTNTMYSVRARFYSSGAPLLILIVHRRSSWKSRKAR